MRRILFILLLFITHHLKAQKEDFARTDFSKADSVAAVYSGHSLKDVRSLALKLTQSLRSEEEKFRAIYSWTCNNIEYDNALYMKSKQKEKINDREELKAWNRKFTVLVFKHLLNKKKTVCSGYAYLLRELAAHVGIKCEIVDGYGRTSIANLRGRGNVNHSWNAVQLHNKWYLCDATWSSGAIDMQALKFVKNYDDAYFLTDPSMFIHSHYPVDSSWMLLHEKPTLTTFLNAPLIYKAALKHKITPSIQQAFDTTVNKGKPVSFGFTVGNSDSIEKMTLYSISPGKAVAFTPLYQDSKGLYCSDIVFNIKGTHVVHLLVNNEYAFTYSVFVK